MKKLMIFAAVSVMVLSIGGRAFATGSSSSWSAKLTFSAGGNTDVYPITIGEGTTADELLKPPPLPGASVTGDSADSVVNAYVVSSSAARQAAKSISTVAVDEPGKVWPIEVQTEAAGDVTLTVDFANFYNTYKFNIIDPVDGTVTTLSSASTSKKLFTATAAETRTLYVMIGRTQTFLASSTNGGVFGVAKVYGISSSDASSGAKVYKDGSVIATVGENGVFNASGLTAGTYTIRVDKERMLGSEQTITVTASGATVALDDLYPGDFNDDGSINLIDILSMKKSYGSASGQSNYDAIYDANGDGNVNLTDILLMKGGYQKSESWK